jgi:hypothetical protein
MNWDAVFWACWVSVAVWCVLGSRPIDELRYKLYGFANLGHALNLFELYRNERDHWRRAGRYKDWVTKRDAIST